jgi:TetR/AcrR family transcriptional regulator, regulator of autoinduction and epiphytic fitness
MARNEQLGEPPVDGRVLRGERNRTAIVEAMLALVQAGDLKPSAKDIAAGAGVSVRSVFQHFDDMESLYAALVDRQMERLDEFAAHATIDANRPFAERLDTFVRQRARLYERISPIRRATLLVAHESPVLQQGLRGAAARHSRDVGAAFAPELGRAHDGAELRSALTLATSWEAWDALRRTQRNSVDAARRVVVALAASTVARSR